MHIARRSNPVDILSMQDSIVGDPAIWRQPKVGFRRSPRFQNTRLRSTIAVTDRSNQDLITTGFLMRRPANGPGSPGGTDEAGSSDATR